VNIKIACSLMFVFFPLSLAWGTVNNSKHDLSYLGGETCSYCHSVHNAVGGLGRPAYMGSLPNITDVYDSNTFDHSTRLTLASVSNSDAPLCLSCHDTTSIDTFSDVNIRDDLHAKIDNTQRDIGLDLSNDHPVGFVFDASLDDQIVAPPADSKVHITFGPNRNEMWCSTCHNVHGGEPGTPFLVMSNQGSDLCFTCHIK